jgi:hypothetical protein
MDEKPLVPRTFEEVINNYGKGESFKAYFDMIELIEGFIAHYDETKVWPGFEEKLASRIIEGGWRKTK